MFSAKLNFLLPFEPSYIPVENYPSLSMLVCTVWDDIDSRDLQEVCSRRQILFTTGLFSHLVRCNLLPEIFILGAFRDCITVSRHQRHCNQAQHSMSRQVCSISCQIPHQCLVIGLHMSLNRAPLCRRVKNQPRKHTTVARRNDIHKHTASKEGRIFKIVSRRLTDTKWPLLTNEAYFTNDCPVPQQQSQHCTIHTKCGQHFPRN